MSFEVNGPSWKPVVQKSGSMENNGGGGNLGYFGRSKKDSEEEKSKNGQEESDIFTKSDDEEDIVLEDIEAHSDLEKVIPTVKDFFKDLLTNNPQHNKEDHKESKNDYGDNFFKKV